jgi:hypothetical protein
MFERLSNIHNSIRNYLSDYIYNKFEQSQQDQYLFYKVIVIIGLFIYIDLQYLL